MESSRNTSSHRCCVLFVHCVPSAPCNPTRAATLFAMRCMRTLHHLSRLGSSCALRLHALTRLPHTTRVFAMFLCLLSRRYRNFHLLVGPFRFALHPPLLSAPLPRQQVRFLFRPHLWSVLPLLVTAISVPLSPLFSHPLASAHHSPPLPHLFALVLLGDIEVTLVAALPYPFFVPSSCLSLRTCFFSFFSSFNGSVTSFHVSSPNHVALTSTTV